VIANKLYALLVTVFKKEPISDVGTKITHNEKRY